MTIVQMSAIPRFHAARKGADAAVLTHDGCTVTWGELEALANRRARLFASAGVKAGDFVTIALPNGNEFYETTFAVWKLGPRRILCLQSCHVPSSPRLSSW